VEAVERVEPEPDLLPHPVNVVFSPEASQHLLKREGIAVVVDRHNFPVEDDRDRDARFDVLDDLREGVGHVVHVPRVDPRAEFGAASSVVALGGRLGHT